jgi:hypothetical protein
MNIIIRINIYIKYIDIIINIILIYKYYYFKYKCLRLCRLWLYNYNNIIIIMDKTLSDLIRIIKMIWIIL